ncbi:MAG: cbb3-type cytochrome oxidase assembly protein CcoS [Candidatus Competibacteraceae bacterium]
MRILLFLIPMALGVIGVALWAFLWAVRTGQFDDLEGPAHRILMDDDDPRIPRHSQQQDNDQSLDD